MRSNVLSSVVTEDTVERKEFKSFGFMEQEDFAGVAIAVSTG